MFIANDSMASNENTTKDTCDYFRNTLLSSDANTKLVETFSFEALFIEFQFVSSLKHKKKTIT